MEENNTCWLSQLGDNFEVQSENATNLKVVYKLCKPKEKHLSISIAELPLQQTFTFDTISYVHLRNFT